MPPLLSRSVPPTSLAVRAVLALALAMVTTLGLLGSGAADASTSMTATTAVNVRSKPSTSASVVGSLHRGQSVRASATSKGWTTIAYGGKTAYVSSRYLSAGNDLPSTETVGKGETATTTTQVNLRTGPGLTEDVVTVLASGTTVTRTGTTAKGWTEVSVAGRRGWVSSQYLTAAAGGLPAVTGKRTTTMDLNVRASSAEDSKVIGLAKKGSTVSITGTTQNDRAQVIWEESVGWVLAKYLADGDTDEPSAPALPKVTGTRYATTVLMLRSTSGSDYTDLGDVATGTKLSITGVTENGRAQIVYGAAVRWATAKYLSKTKPTTSTSGGGSTGVEKGLKPNALKVLKAVRANWPQIVSIGGVRPDALPDHPSGRALDLMIPSYKSKAGKQLGHDLSRWLQARHDELGINYIIYDQHIWNVRRDSEGWRYMASRGSDSANHKNHVHVTVYAKGYAPI